MPFLDTDELCF